MKPPIFISFEGGEGSGKSTQAELLHRRLKERGVEAMLIREPGSTPLGASLRTMLLGQKMDPRAELLLFLAARAQLVTEVIHPALDRGVTVISDRYADSSVAYQGYGRGLGAESVQELNRFATHGLMPHFTFFLNVSPTTGLQRAAKRADPANQRKFEEQAVSFHTLVHQGYLKLAAAEPKRWRVINGEQPVEAIQNAIWAELTKVLDV